MSCCCCEPTAQNGRAACPFCSQNCLPVSRQTMLHQIQSPHNQQLKAANYAFCANRACHTGYFSTVGLIEATIPKTLLRAFQPDQPVMLCYCFDILESTYRDSLQAGGSERIKSFVVQQTKEKLCACESRNPSGRCCLADFRQMEKDHDC